MPETKAPETAQADTEAPAMIRALQMLDALPPAFKPSDDTPLREALPGAWPTIGELREFVARATPTGAGTETREAVIELIVAQAEVKTLDCGTRFWVLRKSPEELLALAPATPAPAVDGVEVNAKRIADLVVQDVCELPDRSSPEDEPEMMLVTGEELHELIVNQIENALAARTPAGAAGDPVGEDASTWGDPDCFAYPECGCRIEGRCGETARPTSPAPTPSPESTLSPAQVATRDGGGDSRWQGCDPDEPYDPLKCAIWAALVPFQNELLATGGVTFMGLRNSIVEAVRSFAIASQRGATTPASAGEGELRALASSLVAEINDLINESGGVWGLHLNGDDATWADITVGGRFERLPSLHDLKIALAAPAASAEGDLRKALDRIANPILHMQREVPEGHQLDGRMARSLVTVEYLQSIARDALAPPGKSVQAIAAPAVDGVEEKRYPYSEPKAWPYWACPDCNCKNFGGVDEQKPDKSFGPGPLIRCVNCKAVFDTRPQAPTEVN